MKIFLNMPGFVVRIFNLWINPKIKSMKISNGRILIKLKCYINIFEFKFTFGLVKVTF